VVLPTVWTREWVTRWNSIKVKIKLDFGNSRNHLYAMTWGGNRDGAGRPKGSQSAQTRKRREAVRVVSQAVVAQFETEHPDAFQGDSVDFMRCIYRNPTLPLDVRLDAASKAARFERPALMAAAVKDLTPARDTGSRNARILELIERGLAGGAVKIIDG
jgi:hypothetical protein